MAIPQKDDIVHQRDGDNELIPRAVELKTISDSATEFLREKMGVPEDEPVEFKIKPATQGELAELSELADQEEVEGEEEEMTDVETEFVAERLIQPDLSAQDLEYIQNPEVAGGLMIALLSESTGTPQDEVAENIQEAIEKEAEKSESFQEDSSEDEAEASDGEESGSSGEGAGEAEED